MEYMESRMQDQIEGAQHTYASMCEEIERLRAALTRLADAADAVGMRHFDTDWLDDEVQSMQSATLSAREILKPNAQGQPPSVPREKPC